MRISIIIPVLNEAKQIIKTLLPLQSMRQRNVEIILVDGGSVDDTCALSSQYVDFIINTQPGRSAQMNAGAEIASGSVFWFLHADTRVPDNADYLIRKQINTEKNWGRFDVGLSGEGVLFSIIAFMMNWRTRITGIATGDQGIFVTKKLFQDIGGYPNIPLMEDIEISKQLNKYMRPRTITEKIMTSSRRWEKKGVLQTILLMWVLRIAYFMGVSPAQLRRWYEA